MNVKKGMKLFLILFLLIANPIASDLSTDIQKISPRLSKAISDKGEQNQFTAWIFFTDKGPDAHLKIKTVKSTLTPRAFNRRLRHRGSNNLVDYYDVPANKQYIQKIKAEITRLRHQSRWFNAVSVEASGISLKRITRFYFVKRIEQVHSLPLPPTPKPLKKSDLDTDKKLIPAHTLDYGPSYYQVNQINVPKLHDLGYSGKGILICMLDAGFNNLTHEALDHLDIVATWDFVNNDPNVSDQIGQMGTGNHGTKTLSTIAGYQPGKLIGPAYASSFLLGKTENSAWERHIEEDHWVAGAEWADEMGADIISSSLGYRDRFTHNETNYTWESMDGESTIVTQGANIAASRGILVVNSAGNEGMAILSQNTLVAPADSPFVVAAGAVDSSGDRVSFSSMGPTADGRIKPDVMAMGVDVYTAGTFGHSSYSYVNGTSFSCPLTAGVAALILEAHPDWTNMDIMEALKQTASRSDSPDHRYGWGILDAYNSQLYIKKHIHPPNKFSVKRIENNLIFFSEYIDRLAWEKNPKNSTSVKYYRIYARPLEITDMEFQLVAELSNQDYSYEVRGLKNGEKYLYKIVVVNKSGEESEPTYARI